MSLPESLPAEEQKNKIEPAPKENCQPIGLRLILPRHLQENRILGLCDPLMKLRLVYPGNGALNLALDSGRMVLRQELRSMRSNPDNMDEAHDMARLAEVFPGLQGAGDIAFYDPHSPVFLNLTPADEESIKALMSQGGFDPSFAQPGYVLNVYGNRPEMAAQVESGLYDFAKGHGYPYLIEAPPRESPPPDTRNQ